MNTQRPLKLYLDTSVISHIDAPDRPDWEAITKAFFQFVTDSGEHVLFISPVVELELANCPNPKRTVLAQFMSDLPYEILTESKAVLELVRAYIAHGVLGPKHSRDLTHLAHAVVARCDFVVSWNMKHLVVARTISGAHVVNLANNYQSPFIVTPLIIIGEHSDDND